MHAGLLTGTRVLDFSIWRPGPYATEMLAESGADVIKVEPPGGDPMRIYPGLFASLNADKRSIVLDLKKDQDRAHAHALAKEADVVIEGFRPGVATRLGIGADEIRKLNPAIVYCSISGIGQTGPLANVSGHDLNYQAWAGTLRPDGKEVQVPGIPIADLATGMAAAYAMCAALVGKARTGEGEYIDIAMTDVLATWTGAAGPDGDGGSVPGYDVFETDHPARPLTLGVVSEDHFWGALCGVLGLPPDLAQLTFEARLSRGTELSERLSAKIEARTRDELLGELLAAGVPAAPILTREEMVSYPHFRHRKAVVTDPWADPATGFPITFATRPAGRSTAPPKLDQHRGEGFCDRPVGK